MRSPNKYYLETEKRLKNSLMSNLKKGGTSFLIEILDTPTPSSLSRKCIGISVILCEVFAIQNESSTWNEGCHFECIFSDKSSNSFFLNPLKVWVQSVSCIPRSILHSKFIPLLPMSLSGDLPNCFPLAI